MSNRRMADLSLAQELEVDPVDAMILLAGADPSQQVMIAGHRHVELLAGLCRRGFSAAGCQAVSGARVSREAVDLLWIPAVASEAEISAALVQLGRNLRPGGMLVVGDERRVKSWSLPSWVAQHGFLATRQVALSGGRGVLLAARKESLGDARQRAAA